MHRILLASLLAGLTSSVALAQDGGREVCILDATETLTSPKKDNLFSMALDCGTETTAQQNAAVLTVQGKENTVDALGYMLSDGYHIRSSSTRNSYAGNRIITTFILLKGGKDAGMSVTPTATMPDELPELMDDEGLDGLDALPEAATPVDDESLPEETEGTEETAGDDEAF
jgi:hypothetical protein